MELGFLYTKGRGVEQDYDKAEDLFSKACNNKNGDACNRLAVFLIDIRKSEDSQKELELYIKACDYGDVKGCTNVSRAYKRKANENHIKLLEYLQKACDLGDKFACKDYKKFSTFEYNVFKH